MSFTFNIPFFSLFLVLLSAIIVPFCSQKDRALHLIRAVQLAVAVLSAILLADLGRSGESFTFMMGHFPAPWEGALTFIELLVCARHRAGCLSKRLFLLTTNPGRGSYSPPHYTEEAQRGDVTYPHGKQVAELGFSLDLSGS